MNQARERARGHRAGASGFSLIETVIAIAVIAVTFIGLIGLLGLGVVNDQTSSQQTIATNIAASILADLRSTPAFAATPVKSTRYGLMLPTTAPASSATPLSGLTASVLYFDNSPAFISLNPASVPVNAAYVANVYMTRIGTIGPTTTPPSVQSNDMVRVVVSWPAKTPAGTAPAGSVDVISQFLVH